MLQFFKFFLSCCDKPPIDTGNELQINTPKNDDGKNMHVLVTHNNHGNNNLTHHNSDTRKRQQSKSSSFISNSENKDGVVGCIQNRKVEPCPDLTFPLPLFSESNRSPQNRMNTKSSNLYNSNNSWYPRPNDTDKSLSNSINYAKYCKKPSEQNNKSNGLPPTGDKFQRFSNTSM